MAKEITKFEEQGYRTYLVGDGNADRNKDGTPRNACLAAEALINAEEQADLTWICPEIEGQYFTRFDISSEIMKLRQDFDPAKATSAVDHVSAGRNSILNNTTKSYTLTELHLGADHAGLLLRLRLQNPNCKTLTTQPNKPQRCRLEPFGAETIAYEKSTRQPLEEWLSQSDPLVTPDDMTTVKAQNAKYKHLQCRAREFNTILNGLSEQIPLRKPGRMKGRQEGPTPRSKVSPFIRKQTANKEGSVKERRNAWAKILLTHKEDMRDLVQQEKDTWKKETAKIEEELKEGDWTGLWARQKNKKPNPKDNTPNSFTNKVVVECKHQEMEEDGTVADPPKKVIHIWKKREVMNHVKTEAHAIAEPPRAPTTEPHDQALEEDIRQEVAGMQREAYTMNDWTPNQADVAIMIKYLREAYTKRTAHGPDDITPDLILFADEIMLECLLALLTLMASAASSPEGWRRMYIILIQKPGRDPQDLRTGYRPICVGSLLMKATERVLLEWTNAKLDKKPHHPAIMAYKKGTGHDMAIFTATAAIMYAKFEARQLNQPQPRIWAVGTDVENAFNGTWRELVEWIEWKKHNMRGTRWSILRSLSGNMRYKVKIHGRKTEEFTQKKGYGQGPTSIPTKYNTSTEPLLQDLEDAGAGIIINGEIILGFCWSDDMLILVTEDKLKAVLLVLSKSSATYKKKLKASKSWALPMCNKQRNEERPVIQLNGADIPVHGTERILGFTLSPKVQGTRAYAAPFRAKARIAIAKLEAIGIHNGPLVRPIQTEKYYKSIVLAVIKNNLAQHQLDTPSGDAYGYELARKMTADVLRRMLGTSNRTSPALLILEAGWDLPDREIIVEKLNFHARMAQKGHNERQKLRKRGREASNREDGPTHVWKGRLIQVEQGETRGRCAEAKRLWQEAGMERQWPPQIGKRVRQRMSKAIALAAKKIMKTRLQAEMERRSVIDGDTPYGELHDGTSWRITNGNKREVGLMTTARLGALMTNAGRSADGAQLDPTCICCHENPDTARHVLLRCPALENPRDELWEQVLDIWDEQQQDEFAEMTDQQQYMTLLGKQMENETDIDQQRQLDKAVKSMLVKMDDIRQCTHELQPMNGRRHNRPPEQSTQMTEQWREMTEHTAILREQAMESDSEEELTEPDDEFSDAE
jgi:hypothetical protein